MYNVLHGLAEHDRTIGLLPAANTLSLSLRPNTCLLTYCAGSVSVSVSDVRPASAGWEVHFDDDKNVGCRA